MEYYALVTKKGLDKILSAIAAEAQVQIAKFCVGDGGGEPVTPRETQTALVNQTWVGDIIKYSKDGDMVSASTVVPEDVGNFTLREMGLIDSDGDLFAVANVPDTLKTKDGGIRATLNLTISIKLENANVVHFDIISDFDTALDKNSSNAVQNKVLAQEIDKLTEEINSIGLVYDPEYHAIELGESGHSGGGGGGSYTPTAAGPDTLGCIKVGSDFSITEDGTLSINKVSNAEIDNMFTDSAIMKQNEAVISSVRAKTSLMQIAQTAIPSKTGDNVRYIADGSDVYHPVEDTVARQAAADNANALNDKVDKIESKGLSSNDYTNEDKDKLNGIEANANKTVVDPKLDTTSRNAVSNYVVTQAIEDINKSLENFLPKGNVVYVKASDTPTEFTQYAEKSNYIIYNDLASALAANSNAEFSEVVILPGTHDIGYINIVENSKKFKNLILRGFSPLYASECILQTTHSQSTMALRINSDNIAIYDLNMQFDKHIYGFDTITKNVVLKNVILKTGGSYHALQIQKAANVEVSNCCFDIKNGSTGLNFACISISATNSLKLYGNTCIALYDYSCSEPTYSIIYGNTNLQKKL